MDARNDKAWQDKKQKNKGDNKSGGNVEESPGKAIEVIVRMKEGDGNIREAEEGRPKRRWFNGEKMVQWLDVVSDEENGLSG